MQAASRKMNILFLCTGNSCRSQIAEAYTNALKGNTFIAYSAGVKAQTNIDPLAMYVLREDPLVKEWLDLSTLRPKTVDDLEIKGVQFDYVITVCDSANESCPVFHGNVQRVHQGFDDPPRLVREQGLAGEPALKVYRDIRDQIKIFIQSLPYGLNINQQEG